MTRAIRPPHDRVVSQDSGSKSCIADDWSPGIEGILNFAVAADNRRVAAAHAGSLKDTNGHADCAVLRVRPHHDSHENTTICKHEHKSWSS
jgi:hypothetical protein